MVVLIFGASGMVGQGVLRQALAATDVAQVISVGRSQLDTQHEKLAQIICDDFSKLADALAAYPTIDACFFCVGKSASGLSEQQYRAVSYELTLEAANALLERHANLSFVYVSGAGTDSTENGKVMWARVKSATENALLNAGFASAFMFRPGVIQPLHGIKSKTTSYRITYQLLAPLFPLIKRFFPNQILTTEQVGEAMLNVARGGHANSILEAGDILVASNTR